MNQLKEILTKKISQTDLFIVMATKNYLDALRNMDGDILAQIDTARKFQKPFFIVFDNRLSDDEIKEIDEYFSNDNIVKKAIINMRSNVWQRDIALEIKKFTRELSGKDEDVQIITHYSND